MKKGQVTLFVIMGLILVLFFLFITSFVLDSNAVKDIAVKQEFVLHDYNEGVVRNEVHNCIESSQRSALTLLANNSGYLSLTTNTKYADVGPANTHDGAVVMMDKDGLYFLDLIVFSKKICNKVYVDVQSCINKTVFEESGFLIETRPFVGFFDIPLYCDAIIRPESVVVKTNYPVKFSKEELSFDISQFSIETPHRLKTAYDYAKVLSFEVQDDKYLGNETYDVSGRCNQFPGFSVSISDRIVVLTDSIAMSRGLPDFSYKFAILDYNITGSCN